MSSQISRRQGRAGISRSGLLDWVVKSIEEEAEQQAPTEEEPREQSFRAFVERVNPSLLQYEHVAKCIDVGERVVTGELRHVIVMMPTRYFKTEIFGRLLAAHFLHRHPTQNVGLTSYGADLAWATSEEARHHFQTDGGKLVRDTTAKKRWGIVGGGEMWAAGVGGPLLGFGFHLGVVDDPQDPEKAHSPTYQKRFADWFPAKFLSRREPGARVLVVMQRLGSGDAIDFLLRREVGEDTDLAPMNWHVVCLQEIKSDAKLGRWTGPRGLPPTCTLEPDTRKLGEILAPSRFDAGTVAHMQLTAGPYVNAAQRQQAPQDPTGDFWQEEWFQTYIELPPNAFNGGWDWDLAYGDDDANSASAGIRSYRGPGAPGAFPIYIDAVEWDWLEFPEVIEWMRSTSGPHYVEAKAAGKSAVQTLRRNSIMAREVKVNKGKFERATLVQPEVSAGRVFVRSSVRRQLLHGERQGLLRVTAESLISRTGDLDVNDVFVQAIQRHVAVRRKKPPPGSYSMRT